MSVFDMDGMKPALDWMVPALAAKVGLRMKSMTPMEHKTGEAQSCVDSIHNLQLGEENNLAGVAQANVKK